jgi:hypothetical protein
MRNRDSKIHSPRYHCCVFLIPQLGRRSTSANRRHHAHKVRSACATRRLREIVASGDLLFEGGVCLFGGGRRDAMPTMAELVFQAAPLPTSFPIAPYFVIERGAECAAREAAS